LLDFHNIFEDSFVFVVEGPAADATDAPQPFDEDDELLSFFRVMEHRWNEIDRGKPKYSGKILSQCHFDHQKSHMD
jgi:hypothetical protein